MVYKKVESFSTEKPLEVDTASSRFVVYLRKNIKSVPNTDNDGKEAEGTHWEMEETQLTKEEYARYAEALTSAEMSVFLERLSLLEDAQAEALLGQAEIHATQMEQDDVLAAILLNQMEG